MTDELKRRGDQCKCPACGWRLDSEAYRCPQCLIYFCYKCRARVSKSDEQYQCADQSCSCYGKLLCGACTIFIPIEQMVTKYRRKEAAIDNPGEIERGAVRNYIIAAYRIVMGSVGAYLIAVIISKMLAISFSYLLWIWIVFEVLVVVGFISELIASLPKISEQELEPFQVSEIIGKHRSCIQCKHPVKEVS